jgi:hypothetical protein
MTNDKISHIEKSNHQEEKIEPKSNSDITESELKIFSTYALKKFHQS